MKLFSVRTLVWASLLVFVSVCLHEINPTYSKPGYEFAMMLALIAVGHVQSGARVNIKTKCESQGKE